VHHVPPRHPPRHRATRRYRVLPRRTLRSRPILRFRPRNSPGFPPRVSDASSSADGHSKPSADTVRSIDTSNRFPLVVTGFSASGSRPEIPPGGQYDRVLRQVAEYARHKVFLRRSRRRETGLAALAGPSFALQPPRPGRPVQVAQLGRAPVVAAGGFASTPAASEMFVQFSRLLYPRPLCSCQQSSYRFRTLPLQVTNAW
jgi:hypothetical protein